MSHLTFNFADFCERSNCDTEPLTRVLSKVQNGAWCAGGAIRRTLIRMPLDSDYDFFFRDADHMAEWEKKLPKTLKMVRETPHHKHWRGTIEGSELPVDIQAIKFRFYASAAELIDSFDYTITQFAYDGETLTTTPMALWDLGRKKLAVHKITYPVATMRRMLKYTSQGFTACAGCMQQILRDTAASPEAMAELDIEYVD